MENTLRLFYSCMLIVSIVTIVSASDAATFDSLVERIVRLEERDRVQQNEINRMEERDQLQQKRITHLEERDRLQKEEVDRLVKRVKSQQDKNKDIRQQLLVQKRKTLQYLCMRTGHMETHTSKRRVSIVDKLVSEANDFSNRRSQRKSLRMGRIRRAENEMDVAFFATLTNHQTHVGVNQVILFDNVVTDIGKAYNNHLGSFIAPVTGTYVFSISILTWVKDAVYYIAKNGNAVSYIICDAQSGYDASSQTVILSLNQHDDITIRNRDTDDQTHGGHFSSFAGFLLTQVNSNVIVG